MMIGSGPTLYIIRYFQGLTIEWRGHRWCEVDFGGWNWWWKHDDVQCLVYRGHWMGSILGDIKKCMAILRGFALQHALFGFWLCNDPWYIPRERSSNHQGFHGRHENLRGRTVTVYFLLVVFYSKIAESIDSIGGWPLDDFYRWHTSGSEALSQQRLNHHAKTH